MIKLFKIGIVIALLAGGYAWYLYNKPVAKLDNADAEYSLNADELFRQFENDEAAANKKYLGKIIEVNGKVRDLSIGDNGELNLIMASESDMFGINCGIGNSSEMQYKNYKVGDSILVKGECTGISMDVVLTRCVIVN
ncbi:MAG: hypothetical protein IPP71_21090 [Bacteroidetes bacterium]|nr:hypothetical protein [Bacteroidota bacterium]